MPARVQEGVEINALVWESSLQRMSASSRHSSLKQEIYGYCVLRSDIRISWF